MLRILAFIILMLSMLFLPFWVLVLFTFFAMIYFFMFWEAVLIFLFSDLLHGIPENKTFHIIFLSFFIALLMLIIIEFLKRKLNFHSRKR
jgi:hypothetical protein